MLDRRRRNELEGTLALGRLAEKMVFALGRVIRGEPLRPGDIAAIDEARDLFELMAKDDVIVVDVAPNRMLNDDSYLDALHVVQVRAAGEGAAEERARRFVELLDSARGGAVSPEERGELQTLRELFDEVGETTLVRAGELSRTPQEPSWRRIRPAISSF